MTHNYQSASPCAVASKLVHQLSLKQLGQVYFRIISCHNADDCFRHSGAMLTLYLPCSAKAVDDGLFVSADWLMDKTVEDEEQKDVTCAGSDVWRAGETYLNVTKLGATSLGETPVGLRSSQGEESIVALEELGALGSRGTVWCTKNWEMLACSKTIRWTLYSRLRCQPAQI